MLDKPTETDNTCLRRTIGKELLGSFPRRRLALCPLPHIGHKNFPEKTKQAEELAGVIESMMVELESHM